MSSDCGQEASESSSPEVWYPIPSQRAGSSSVSHGQCPTCNIHFICGWLSWVGGRLTVRSPQGPQNDTFPSLDSSRAGKFPLHSLLPYLCGLHQPTLRGTSPTTTQTPQLWKVEFSPIATSGLVPESPSAAGALARLLVPAHINLQMSIAREKYAHDDIFLNFSRSYSCSCQ